MVQLDTASICNTLPDKIAQLLIPLGQTKKTILLSAKQPYSPMTTLSSNLWVNCKRLLLSALDYANLGLVKIPADEVNWRGTSHGTETLSNLHPVASVQLPTAETLHSRDIPMLQEPMLAPHVWLFRIQTYPSRPATITLVWVLKVFPDVHTGLGQFGKPFSFNLNTLVTLVHDAIQGQPLARHNQRAVCSKLIFSLYYVFYYLSSKLIFRYR